MKQYFLRHVVFSLMIFVAVMPFVSIASSASCDGPTCGKIFYFNPSRTEYARFNDRYWTVGPSYPARPLPKQANGSISFEAVVVSIYGCSNKLFICIDGLGSVFAIPKSRLDPHATYIIAGSRLRIEKCLRGDAKVCQVALISSTCQKSLSGGCIIPKLQEGIKSEYGKYNGPALYFIYNEDVGVTSYGEAETHLSNLQEMVSVATQFMLSGDVGLLKINLDLTKAKKVAY